MSWSNLVSTVAAAVAALASLAAVYLSRQQWREQRRPLLTAALGVFPSTQPGAPAHVLLGVFNDGGGTARDIKLRTLDNARWRNHPSVQTFQIKRWTTLGPGRRWIAADLGSEWNVKPHAKDVGLLRVGIECEGCPEEVFDLDPTQLFPD